MIRALKFLAKANMLNMRSKYHRAQIDRHRAKLEVIRFEATIMQTFLELDLVE